MTTDGGVFSCTQGPTLFLIHGCTVITEMTEIWRKPKIEKHRERRFSEKSSRTIRSQQPSVLRKGLAARGKFEMKRNLNHPKRTVNAYLGANCFDIPQLEHPWGKTMLSRPRTLKSARKKLENTKNANISEVLFLQSLSPLFQRIRRANKMKKRFLCRSRSFRPLNWARKFLPKMVGGLLPGESGFSSQIYI
ncbi:unnamed protein product, partial [Nesidiocoris tenuis]